jgi:hypothetical protein
LASVFTGGLSRLRNAPRAAFAENSSERLISALSFHKFCELLPEPAPQPDRRLSSNSAMSSTFTFSPLCVPAMPSVISPRHPATKCPQSAQHDSDSSDDK